MLDVLEAVDGQRILTATTRSFTAAAQAGLSPHVSVRGELGYSGFGDFGRRTHLDLGVSLSH